MSDEVDFDIIIFYEHVGREFATVKALVDKFKRHNIRVKAYSYLYEYYKCLSDYEDSTPTHLIVPFIYTKNSLSRYRHIIEKNPRLKIINMRHEQIVAPFNIAKACPADSIALSNIIHVSWSRESSNMLLKSGVSSSNIFEICSPRIPKKLNDEQQDKLRKRLSFEFGLDSSKEWVLFCEDRDWVINDKEKMTKVLQGFNISQTNINRFFINRNESLKMFCEEVNSLTSNFFNHYEFIYRSHPGVTGKLNLSKNVRMISKYSLHDWLQCVSVNIVDGSSSCFESDSLNIRTARHQPIAGDTKFRVFGVSKYLKLKHINDLLKSDVLINLDKQKNKMIYQDYIGSKEINFNDTFVNKVLHHKEQIIAERNLYIKRLYFLRKWIFEKLITRLPHKHFFFITNYFGYNWLSKDRPNED